MESLPTEMRAPFQSFVLKKILGEKSESMTQEEWDMKTLKWFDIYAKDISDIIDNTENKKIRDLIIAGKYEEASVLVIKILDAEKWAKAA